ncbi:MAG: hypothetical protein HC801_12825 [Nitrospira sp.]|nr:hypothetical protein [Nitrospira sp.]
MHFVGVGIFIAAGSCAIHDGVVVVVVREDVETRETTAPLPQDLESAHRLIAKLLSSEASLREELDQSSKREKILHDSGTPQLVTPAQLLKNAQLWFWFGPEFCLRAAISLLEQHR